MDIIKTTNLYKTVVLLAWPVVVRMSLNMVVNLVDMIMIGQLGANAIAAVGVSTQLFFTAIAAIAAFGVGTTTLVAQYTGAGDKAGAREVARQSLVFSALITFSLSVLAFIFARPLIKGVLFLLEDDGGAIMDLAVSYFRIISVSISMRFLLIVINGMFQGVGDTRTPLYIMIVTNLVNISGNYLLIFGVGPFPAMGVEGAAIATSISGFVGGFLALYMLFSGKKDISVSFDRYFKIRWDLVRKMLAIGIPSSIEQLIVHSSQVFYTAMIGGLGATVMAANQILLVAFNVTFLPGLGFAIAANTLVGQFQGAKNSNMAARSGFVTTMLSIVAMSTVGLVFFFWPQSVLSLFTGEEGVIHVATSSLLLLAIAQPFIGISMSFTGALRGAGDTRFIMYLIATNLIVIRLVITVIALGLGLGLFGGWLGFFLEFVIRAAVLYKRFRSGIWQQLEFVSQS